MTPLTRIRSAAKHLRQEHRLHTKSALRALAIAITTRRIKLELTRKQVAAKAKISYANLSHIENAENWPTVPVYRALCRVLRVGRPPWL